MAIVPGDQLALWASAAQAASVLPGVHDHAQCLPKSGEARELAKVATVDPGLCKTVGSAYVGSNPTPATKVAGHDWYAKIARPLKVSGVANRRLCLRRVESST